VNDLKFEIVNLRETKQFQFKKDIRPFFNTTVKSLKTKLNYKLGSLMLHLPQKPSTFTPSAVTLGEKIGEGTFGVIRKARFQHIQVNVAVKEIKLCQHTDEIVVEGNIMQHLHTHENFPFCFGLIGKKALMMELIVNNDGSISPNIHNMFRSSCALPKCSLKCISLQIIDAVSYLHSKGLLHNDIHGGNIIVRDCKFVKVIDFGKVSMLSNPLTYNLSAEKRKLYNKNHKHLAYELRNINNSKQSPATDIYSIGYIFRKYFDKTCQHRTFSKLVSQMMFVNPDKRPSLKTVYKEINQC
jgi:serine/threonine protein kinase